MDEQGHTPVPLADAGGDPRAPSPTSPFVHPNPGMRRDYSLSEMYELQMEYMSESEDETSVFNRVTMIASKKSLLPKDLQDKGIDMEDSLAPRFSLETGLSYRTMRTISEMQSVLDRAAALVPNRNRAFLVDPHGVAKSILSGADSLDEISIAWMTLSSRMDLAQRFLEKYEAEYQIADPALMPLSPASTAAEIYDNFPTKKSALTQLTYMYDQVPHHQVHLPASYDKDTGYLPSHFPASNGLRRAFPPRRPEPNPSVISYTLNGERVEKHYYSKGGKWEKEVEEKLAKGEEARKSPSTADLGRARDEKEQNSKSLHQVEESPEEESSSHYWSGTQLLSKAPVDFPTPFKNPNQHLTIRSPRTNVPGPYLPNPIAGMASSARPYSTESISQGMAKWRRQEATRYGPPSKNFWNQSEPRGSGTPREAPPHLAARSAVGPRDGGGFERKGDKEGRQEGLGEAGVPEDKKREERRQQGAGAGPPGGGDDGGDDDPRGRRDPSDLRDPRPPRDRWPEGPDDGGNRGRPPNRPPPGPPSSHGGGGGGGDGDPGPNNNAWMRFPYIAPGAPYGTLVPTIKPEVKISELPEWDGAHNTAIDYFWEVGQMAALKGWMPEALGYWLPSRLKKPSSVQMWFSTLSVARQEEMRSHYLSYLKVIKERFLGKKWQLVTNLDFNQQAFRQSGHEKESPQEFLTRRIRYTRLLAEADDGGPLEVFLVMRRAPITWSTILVIENIESSEELYEKVNDHDEELLASVNRNSGDSLNVQNLVHTLRRLGFSQSPVRANRQANLASAGGRAADDFADEEIFTEGTAAGSGSTEGLETIRQVYQTIKKRQRPPPPNGYPFTKNDHVTTKMGKAPPSPCKVCGSANHWDRECPDWHVYIERQKRGVLVVVTTPEDDEVGLLYHSAFCVLLEDRLGPSL
ncbi:hypothetical protein C8R43DRAFT_1120148 [Mycena crocata]|nr:hypothetical protein C8R43DRAFT_1120148 [Mycena crocata]